MARISILGLGRVGLVTAVCFAKRGFRVSGVDVDREKLEALRSCKAPFFEPDLDAYVREVVKNGTLAFTDDPEESCEADFIYITVGTPSAVDGKIDLAQVRSGATAVGRSLRKCRHSQTVVVKSTVCPGTTRNVIKPILERESGRRVGDGLGLVFNPEFLREGNAIRDTEYPDRIVIGSDDAGAPGALEELYREFHGANLPPLILTTYENAELIKYANNAFLATKISFMNTIATIAERIPNADITIVSRGIGVDARIGPSFLGAGLGYGGPCLPKDLRALVQLSEQLGYDPQLLRAVAEINQEQALKAVGFVKAVLGPIRGKKVAVLGLAFKPSTDDMRGAVSIPIIEHLLQHGAEVKAYDPVAIDAAKKVLGDRIKYEGSARECLRNAESAVVVTEWDEFKCLTPADFLSLMRKPAVFDGRRIYDPNLMRSAGILFSAIGLGQSAEQTVLGAIDPRS